MKVYNEEKSQILENVNLELGYLKSDILVISEEEQEQFHYEEKCYDNGGVAKYRVIDKPYKPAEYEDIQVYVLYTEKEILNIELSQINSWFEKYDNQVKQYERAIRRGEEFDKDIVQLDEEADLKQKRIREINQRLKEIKKEEQQDATN